MKCQRMGNIWNIVTFDILKLYETVKKVLTELRQSVAEVFFPMYSSGTKALSISIALDCISPVLAKHWDRIPRGVVGIPSLSGFKRRLDNVLTFGQP